MRFLRFSARQDRVARPGVKSRVMDGRFGRWLALPGSSSDRQGLAADGDGRDPALEGRAPELGEAEDPSAPHPVLRAARAALPGIDTIGRLIADSGGLRAVPPRPEKLGPAQASATPEAAQAQGLPGAVPRGILTVDTVTAVRDRGCDATCLPASTTAAGSAWWCHAGVFSRRARDFADLVFDLLPPGAPGAVR